MPTEKVSELPFCVDDEHHPNKKGLSPGQYKHTCPKCGQIEYFTVWPKWMEKEAEPWPTQPLPFPGPFFEPYRPAPWNPSIPPFTPTYPSPWDPDITRPRIICMVERTHH